MGEPGSAEVHTWLRSLEKEAGQSGIRVLLGGEAKSRQEVIDAVRRCIAPHAGFYRHYQYAGIVCGFPFGVDPGEGGSYEPAHHRGLVRRPGDRVSERVGWFIAGEIAVMVPVFVFGLVFGVSMDYGVFLLSRMTEAFRETGQVDAAIQEGLASTGKLITAAAAILIAVTLPFAFGEVEGVRQLGAASLLPYGLTLRCCGCLWCRP